jgi:hypothetical protein
MWVREDREQIYSDVVSWVKAALGKGAHAFILSTQGTNFPPPSEVYHEVGERLGKDVEEIVKDSTSGFAAGRTFTEHFGVIRQ